MSPKAQADDLATAALRPDEARRYRAYVIGLGVLTPLSLLALPVTGVGAAGTWVQILAVGLIGLSSVLLGRHLRHPDAYRPNLRLVLFALPQSIGGVLLYATLGPFSPPLLAILVAGVYVTGLSSQRAISKATTAYAVVVSTTAMLAVAFRLVPDVGLIRVGHTPTGGLLVATGLYEAVVLMVAWLARDARRSTVTVLVELERATREAKANEAALAEANQALDRALGEGVGRRTGERVGEWVLGNVLGRGGMGEVYEARSTDRDGAVKLLLVDGEGGAETIERFRREAEILTQLEGPHVVKVFEVGETNGQPYIAMERLDGENLGGLLRKRRALPLAEVAVLVSHAALALEQARAAGVVHRDVKPQNLFWVERTRSWKVLDFGVAKLARSSGTLTKGAIVGTPGYMAPEQITGGDIDHRTDVFALAAVAYRALTGSPPFSADDPAATLFNVVFRQPTRPGTLAPLSADVELVLALGLAKQVEDRPARALELAAMLDETARGVPLGATPRRRASELLSAAPWGSEPPSAKRGDATVQAATRPE